MISDKMKALTKNNSVIRAMFEEGKRLAKEYGEENVFDFSIGNPNVPAPYEVTNAIADVVNEEDSLVLHGYMSNAGYDDVRETIAQSLNERFETSFNKLNNPFLQAEDFGCARHRHHRHRQTPGSSGALAEEQIQPPLL